MSLGADDLIEPLEPTKSALIEPDDEEENRPQERIEAGPPLFDPLPPGSGCGRPLAGAAKVRVQSREEAEFLELPASAQGTRPIIRVRSEHGPIRDADQLAENLNDFRLWGRYESGSSAASEGTAPEARGA